jgi:hypothetical protein
MLLHLLYDREGNHQRYNRLICPPSLPLSTIDQLCLRGDEISADVT